MKQFLLILTFALISFTLHAQVGINTEDPQAALDIVAGVIPSEKDGLLIPRIDEFPMGVDADQNGMLVFITGDGVPVKGFYYWDHIGSSWTSLQGMGAGSDNQTITNFSFDSVSGMLTLEIEDDGVVPQIVDLSTLGGGGSTDNQNLEAPSLVGTVLNLNIESGTGTFIDLAPLQDGTGTDNQTIDNFDFNSGTGIVTLELENDGIAPQTIDLSSLAGTGGTDDQNLETPTLAGTTLNLNIEDGTGTSIDLAPLQDGTGTDNQTIDNFDFNPGTGIVTLELENDGIAPQTIDLSSLAGTGGTDDQNLTTPTLAGTTLNLNIEDGTGTSIDLAPLQDGTGTDDQSIDNFDFNPGTGIVTLELENDGIAPQTIDLSSLAGTGGTDDQNLETPTLAGTTLNLNIEDGTGTSIDLAPLQDGTGTDNQNLTAPTLAGTTLNLNIEDGTGTSIDLAPLQDGTGTDDQNLTTPTLAGTTLNLNIEDGTGTSIDLAPLQDGTGTDDQSIDNFYFNPGTGIVTLELENDGIAPQTIDLSSLAGTGGTDDQNLETPTLAGTTLNLNIEDGTGTFIDLAPLQDGTGTDDQNLTTPTLAGTTLNLNIEDGTGTSIDLAPLQDGTGTDNQTVDKLNLNGTTLELSLEDDAVADVTVDLSSLIGVEKIDDLTDGKSDNDGTQDGSSVFLGLASGSADDSSDNHNVGVGFQALEENISGENNTGIGYLALTANETGGQNTAVGQASLHANVAGTGNTGIGYHALFANTGSNNTAVGNGSLGNNVASEFNAALGTQALTFNTAGSNTAMGYRASYSNNAGTRNAAFGLQSLNFNVSGNDNIAIGYRSGYTATGNGNIYLGSEAGNGAVGDNKLFIENTGADEDNALLYGEFGTDATTTGNVLRTNGQLQIGNPTGTGYALPTNQGAANDVLTSNGDGTTQWAAGGATMAQIMTNPQYPDGFSGFTPITHQLGSADYTVPAGKNLYITMYTPLGATNLQINGSIIAVASNNTGYSKLPNPILAGVGDVVSVLNNNGTINGYLVDAAITPITQDISSTSYTVPANKNLVVLSVSSDTAFNSNTASYSINGELIYSGKGNSYANDTVGFYGPIFLSAGDVFSANNTACFNGYLIDN